MRLSDYDCYLILRSLEHYQTNVCGHDDSWDRYETVIQKVKAYRENYSTED